MAELRGTCECNLQVVTKTFWSGVDARRRFIRCATNDRGFDQWIDPPLGERACEVIAERIRDENKCHGYYMRR